jgi:hypothetical protein
MQFGSNVSAERGDLKDRGIVTGYFATALSGVASISFHSA